MSYLIFDIHNEKPTPNFAAFKRSGVTGMYHKVSEGASFVDQKFHTRAVAARKAGLRVGGYHFAYPTDSYDGVAEARFFARNLGKIDRRDLRPVLDFETNSRGMSGYDLEKWARQFNQEFKRITGIYPMFYASQNYIDKMRPLNVPIGNQLWYAHYGPNDGKRHPVAVPPPWKNVALHQYTSVGHIGSYGPVDLSHCTSLRKILAHPITGLV